MTVLLLLVSACGSGNTTTLAVSPSSPSTSADAPPEPTPTTPPSTADGELQLIVLPGEDGRMPDDVEIGCPSGPHFPASALDEVFPLEGSGLEHIEEAIRPFLDSAEGAFWPQDGWLVLHHTDDEAILVHAGVELAFQGVLREGDEWNWAGSSAGRECPLRTRAAAGTNTVNWRFDPNAEAPDAPSTSFTVLVTERECASGKAMGDRLLGPEIVVTDDAVYIAFAATPPPEPEQTCPSNPEQLVNIDLPEPLGDRTIEDGLSLAGDLRDYLP